MAWILFAFMHHIDFIYVAMHNGFEIIMIS